jgi:hypothetical protein
VFEGPDGRLACDRGKVVEEFVQRLSSFQIVQERLERNARSSENRRPPPSTSGSLVITPLGEAIAAASCSISSLLHPWCEKHVAMTLEISGQTSNLTRRNGGVQLEGFGFAPPSINCCTDAATMSSKSAFLFLALSTVASCCVFDESGTGWDLSR